MAWFGQAENGLTMRLRGAASPRRANANDRNQADLNHA
jgi:hypothetical protein